MGALQSFAEFVAAPVNRRTHAEGPAASSGPRPARRPRPVPSPAGSTRRRRTCRCCACTGTSTRPARRRRAVRRPGRAAGRAGPLRHPDADRQGVAPDRLGRSAARRQAGRPTRARSGGAFCAHWHLFRGTPSRYWLEHEFAEVFGVPRTRRPRPPTSCTTRSPSGSPSRSSGPGRCSTGSGSRSWPPRTPRRTTSPHHASWPADRPGRVIPTFRPDDVVHLDRPGWAGRGPSSGRAGRASTPATTTATCEAIRQRRQAFVAAGARAPTTVT